MIAEALNPAIPKPDAPVAVVTEGNTDADVRARFRQATEPKPEVNVQDISTAKNPITGESIVPKEQKPEEKKKVEGKTDIPDEFFGESAPQEDEFDRLMKEEVKGQVKNENFKRFKDATAAKVAKLTKELEETRGKLPKDDYVPEKTAKQLETLQKRRDELEELVNRKYVEESPEFKEKFTSEREAVVKGLNRLGKDLGVPEDVIHQLLGSSPKRQIEILDGLDLSANASSRINALLEQHEQINVKQADYLSDWKTRKGELEESQRAAEDKEKTRIKGLYDRAFEDVLSDVTKNNPLFQTKDGNDNWNNQTKELIEEARKYFNAENSTPHKDAEMFLAGVAARRATAMMDKAISLYRETKKELDEMKAAGPGGGHGSETSREDPTKNMSPDERARWTFNQARATAVNGYVG
jgi:hypothetical protein